MKELQFGRLICLFAIGFALIVFTACTTEDIGEAENLQNFETNADSGGSNGSKGSRGGS